MRAIRQYNDVYNCIEIFGYDDNTQHIHISNRAFSRLARGRAGAVQRPVKVRRRSSPLFGSRFFTIASSIAILGMSRSSIYINKRQKVAEAISQASCNREIRKINLAIQCVRNETTYVSRTLSRDLIHRSQHVSQKLLYNTISSIQENPRPRPTMNLHNPQTTCTTSNIFRRESSSGVKAQLVIQIHRRIQCAGRFNGRRLISARNSDSRREKTAGNCAAAAGSSV